MNAQHTPTAGQRVLGLLNIQPGEGRLTGLLLLLYLSLVTAGVFVQSIAFGLFVSTLGPQNLPLAYISIAALASLVAVVYLKLLERLAYARLLKLTVAFCAGVCAFFWLGLNTPLAAGFIFFLPVWYQVLINLSNLVVWPLAGRLFDLRQGKRLFGIIGAGNWIANIAGGIILAPLVTRFGTANMLLISIAALGASALILRAIAQRHLQPAAPVAAPVAPKAQAQPAKKPPLIKSRYVALIIAYVCLWWVAFFFVDNIFYDRASSQFTNAVDLTAFIGTLLSITGAIALVVTTLVSSRVLQRYGLRTGLVLMPALVTAFIAAVAVFGALGAAVVIPFFFATLAKIANVSLGFSLSQAANSVTYQALPGEAHARVQTVAEGIVQPISVGVAGVLLLVLNTWLDFGATRLAFVFLVLAAGWIAVIVLLAREYPHALKHVLLKRQFREPETFIADVSAVDVLTQGLRNPKPGVAIYAMNMLAQTAPAQLSQHIAGMMYHTSAEVREAALQKIEAMNLRPAADDVRKLLLVEESPQVKCAALRALAAIDDEADDGLVVYLRDDDARVAKGALEGLLLHGEVKGVLAAQSRLAQWAQSPQAGLREMAARAIGEASAASERATLSGLLNDRDVRVRREALWAAGRVKVAALWPQVIDACDAPETAIAAKQALAGGGVQALALIQDALQVKNKTRASRMALAEACSRMDGTVVTSALQLMAEEEDAGVRSLALAALAARHVSIEDDDARAGMRQEASHMAWLCATLIDLSEQESCAVKLLLPAFHTECDAARDRMLLWLALGANANAVMKAREALLHHVAVQRTYALEVIDAQLPAEMKGWVMPAMESLTPAERLKQWRNVFPQTQQPAHARLRQAIVGAPAAWLAPWTKACALYAVGALPAPECADVATVASHSPERVVRDMALWAGARLSTKGRQGGATMLSTVERVMILKGVSMFADTPDDVLAEVAALFHELDAGAGEMLFEKGDMGDCLYVIVSGRVRIYDGARLLNELNEGEMFGEMTLLDPEPRTATAMASEQSRLLRLDRDSFFALIQAQPQVSTGVIRMLTRRLRERVQDISRLDAQVRALAGATKGV